MSRNHVSQYMMTYSTVLLSVAFDTTHITHLLDENIPIASYEVLGTPIVVGDLGAVRTQIKRTIGPLTIKVTVVAKLYRKDGRWFVGSVIPAGEEDSPEYLQKLLTEEQDCKKQ